MRAREKKSASLRDSLALRGWYFAKRDGRYISFMAGDKDGTLVSSSSARGLMKRIMDIEVKRGINIYYLKFTGVSDLMVDELHSLLSELKSSNTIWINYIVDGFKAIGDKYDVEFKYYQYKNDAGPVLELLSNKKVLEIINLSESKIL